ncbi:23S rRNA (guanosine(2251)-2'-O)-methyltransferase RlmB [Derxia lacustris]|uniref:23S rRNA (guanosine(2251)-2'-O)-methyltransferase RlmB n=1 Tax=Derxia lacustris TaxID=764842 RepID=UPI000A1767E5|nr:23S rRNA (guanosine(2251)-2'-O)-methyltransferase RlmB [Derxia lacustris]
MTKPSKVLHGFHAVTARLRHAPASIRQLYVEQSRRDRRMQDFIARATEAGLKPTPVDAARINGVAGNDRHQGVVAVVDEIEIARTLDDVLDLLPQGEDALLLVLDSITDPHNLGACLRVADGAGAHAVVAPKDRAAGLSGVVAKAASGAAESVPYVVVTNLARSLREMKDAGLRIIGTTDDAPKTIFEADLSGPIALVLGAEGEGMRRLTRDTCDELVSIPMAGAVESLNVSVASGVCLYEALRQRRKPA